MSLSQLNLAGCSEPLDEGCASGRVSIDVSITAILADRKQSDEVLSNEATIDWRDAFGRGGYPYHLAKELMGFV